MRRVHRHIEDDLRVFHRRCRKKRQDILIGQINAVNSFLRCPGLSADPVSLDIGVAPAAVGDHALQRITHLFTGLFADDPSLRGRLALHDDIFADEVAEALRDIGRIQRAAVDDGAECRHQLDRRDREPLPERHGRCLQLAHLLQIEHDAGALSGKVDPGLLSEAEFLHIFIQPLCAHAPRDLDKARVRRIFQNLQERLQAMAAGAP